MRNPLSIFETSTDLDARLKAAVPAAAVPVELHDEIMHAVRNSRRARLPARPSVWRWMPACGLATATMVVLCWMAFRPTPDPQPFNVAAVALEETQALAQSAPTTALSPLSEEMESLKRDLNGAVQFVIASVP